jgi:hypothetical protein
MVSKLMGASLPAALAVLLAQSCQGIRSWKPKAVQTPLSQCVDEYAAGLDSIRAHLGDGVRSISLEKPVVTSSQPIVLGVGAGTTATHLVYDVLFDGFGMEGRHYDLNHTWTVNLEDRMGRCNPLGSYECHAKGKPFWDGVATFGNFSRRQAAKCHEDMATFPITKMDGMDFMLDEPVPNVFLRLFLSFPEAKFILTTRPSRDWAANRLRDHAGGFAQLQDPCGEHVGFYSVEEHAGMLDLHHEFVRCVVPSSRLLEVDFWRDAPEVSSQFMARVSALVGRKPKGDWSDYVPVVEEGIQPCLYNCGK